VTGPPFIEDINQEDNTVSENIKIEVLKPFKVRLQPGDPIKEFSPGKAVLTPEEQKHWFIKGCKKERWIPADGEDEAPAQGADLQARMLAVFPSLVDTDLKTDGTPTVAAMEKALGVTVKAAQVAEAWAIFQQMQDKE